MSDALSSQPYSFSKLFLKGTMLNRFWMVALRVFSTVNSFLILKALSVFQYGLYQLILSFAALASGFLSSSLDGLILTDISRLLAAEEKDKAKKLFGEYAIVKFAFSAVLTAAVFFGSGLIARFYDNDIGFFVRIISFYFIADALLSLAKIFFKSTLSFSMIFSSTAIEVLKLVLLVIFLLIGQVGVREVILVYVFSQFAGILLVFIRFFPEYRQTFGGVAMFRERLLPGILKGYGKWAVLRDYGNAFFKNLRPFFIGYFVNIEAVGLFNLALNLRSFLEGMIPLDMFSMLMPREVSRGDERLKHLLSRSLKYSFIIGIIFFLAGITFVPPLINLLLPKYQPAMPLFRVLFVLCIFLGYQQFMSALFVSLRQQHFLFIQPFINGFLTVVLSLIFLPLFGLWGAVAAFMMEYLIVSLVVYIYFLRIQPQLCLHFRELFSFDAYDRAFLRNIYHDAKKMIFIRVG